MGRYLDVVSFIGSENKGFMWYIFFSWYQACGKPRHHLVPVSIIQKCLFQDTLAKKDMRVHRGMSQIHLLITQWLVFFKVF